MALYWLAFPPINWWLLAWLAPVGWIRVILNRTCPARRPLLVLYGMGLLHWLSMTYWVALPHHLAAVGWVVLASYLAIYSVGFVLLARWLIHRSQWTPLAAIPVAWVTMEVLRTNLFTGFGLVLLAHSQVDFLPLLQVSHWTGAYGVSFLVMLGATLLSLLVLRRVTNDPPPVWPSRMGFAAAATGIGICLLYGVAILRSPVESTGRGRVAIIQGSLDTEFAETREDFERLERVRKAAFQDYSRMTSDVTKKQQVDLVLWPETMFDGYYGVIQYDAEMADRIMGADKITMEHFANVCEVATKQHIQQFGVNCLLGSTLTHYHPQGADRYNSAVYYDAAGNLVGMYHKMHPVMFGEYIPLGNVFPWLYNLAPIPGALTPGESPRVFVAGGLRVAPNICFENTVPHLIRRNLKTLQQPDTSPNVLATLTNDGWFWGSSLLDMHLACGIFRAVENRRPMLIAANTGISAHIDPCGRVLQSTPKRVSRFILTDVAGSEQWSFYTQYGDCLGWVCCLASGMGVWIGKRRRMENK